MLLAFHHRTSLYLGICLLVNKQAFYHPGLFLLGHGILAITLEICQHDTASMYFRVSASLLTDIASVYSPCRSYVH